MTFRLLCAAPVPVKYRRLDSKHDVLPLVGLLPFAMTLWEFKVHLEPTPPITNIAQFIALSLQTNMGGGLEGSL